MISSGLVAVGTVAVAIGGVHNNPSRILISNDDNTDSVFIGGSNVGTANGLHVQKLEKIQLDLAPLEQVYAVSSQTNHTMSYLRQAL